MVSEGSMAKIHQKHMVFQSFSRPKIKKMRLAYTRSIFFDFWTPQEVQRRSRVPNSAPRAPKMDSIAPKRAPRAPKMDSRSPKIAQSALKLVPSWPQERPSWPQEAPSRAQEAPKRLQVEPKRCPRRSKQTFASELLRDSLTKRFRKSF